LSAVTRAQRFYDIRCGVTARRGAAASTRRDDAAASSTKRREDNGQGAPAFSLREIAARQTRPHVPRKCRACEDTGHSHQGAFPRRRLSGDARLRRDPSASRMPNSRVRALTEKTPARLRTPTNDNHQRGGCKHAEHQ